MIKEIILSDETVHIENLKKDGFITRFKLEEDNENYIYIDGKTPIKVEIKCFVTKPPPAGFKPCPECGSFIISSKQKVLILQDKNVFSKTDYIGITIIDADNDKYELTIKTEERERFSLMDF